MTYKRLRIISLISALILLFSACSRADISDNVTARQSSNDGITVSGAMGLQAEDIPEYSGSPYITVNNNIPDFKKSEITTSSYESYSKLDRYGRCGECIACLGRDLMPTEERENISEVKPTGWHSIRYSFIDGESLYNRCHLIAFQLADENANEKNLITGTRYMNTEGMLPFEIETGDYVRETNNHVMYRVTPIYKGTELVARGVHMEAYSVEDNGKGICFNVFCYNVQPRIEIDYKTGKAWEINAQTSTKNAKVKYIININSKKFHRPDCSGAKSISSKNKEYSNENRDTLIAKGYTPCGECNP